MRAENISTKSPVTQLRYVWPALGLALLLHGALFILLMNGSPSIPEPRLIRDSLEVTLVEAPQVAAPSTQTMPPPSRVPTVVPVPIPKVKSESKPSPEAKLEFEPIPRLESSPKSENSPEIETVTKPKPKPKPETSSPPPPGNTITAAPSGRDLLAGATSSVRDQGFAMQAQGVPQNTPSQRAARERYIASWTRRVEDIGNRMYPAPAHLAGQLRIRVVIDAGGQLVQAEVIQSSGHPELDQAALKAVEAAGPYRPFDQGLAGLERLEFTRTWRFGEGNNFGVH